MRRPGRAWLLLAPALLLVLFLTYQLAGNKGAARRGSPNAAASFGHAVRPCANDTAAQAEQLAAAAALAQQLSTARGEAQSLRQQLVDARNSSGGAQKQQLADARNSSGGGAEQQRQLQEAMMYWKHTQPVPGAHSVSLMLQQLDQTSRPLSGLNGSFSPWSKAYIRAANLSAETV